jgi:hypothetical protein
MTKPINMNKLLSMGPELLQQLKDNISTLEGLASIAQTETATNSFLGSVKSNQNLIEKTENNIEDKDCLLDMLQRIENNIDLFQEQSTKRFFGGCEDFAQRLKDKVEENRALRKRCESI